jgi:hypothetical protein
MTRRGIPPPEHGRELGPPAVPAACPDACHMQRMPSRGHVQAIVRSARRFEVVRTELGHGHPSRRGALRHRGTVDSAEHGPGRIAGSLRDRSAPSSTDASRSTWVVVGFDQTLSVHRMVLHYPGRPSRRPCTTEAMPRPRTQTPGPDDAGSDLPNLRRPTGYPVAGPAWQQPGSIRAVPSQTGTATPPAAVVLRRRLQIGVR